MEDFADITTPLKQFVDAVYAPLSMPNRERNFEEKATNLDEHTSRCTSTAMLVAKCGPCKNKKTVEAIIDTANHVSPQFEIQPTVFSVCKPHVSRVCSFHKNYDAASAVLVTTVPGQSANV